MHFDPKGDQGALEEFFEPVLLTHLVLQIVNRRLEQQGFYRALREIPAYQKLNAAMAALQPTPLPDATGMWQRLKQWVRQL